MSKKRISAEHYFNRAANWSVMMSRRGEITQLPHNAKPERELYWELNSQSESLRERISELEVKIENSPRTNRSLRRYYAQQKKEAERTINNLRIAMNQEFAREYSIKFVALARQTLPEDIFMKLDRLARAGCNTYQRRHFTRDTGLILTNKDSFEDSCQGRRDMEDAGTPRP